MQCRSVPTFSAAFCLLNNHPAFAVFVKKSLSLLSTISGHSLVVISVTQPTSKPAPLLSLLHPPLQPAAFGGQRRPLQCVAWSWAGASLPPSSTQSSCHMRLSTLQLMQRRGITAALLLPSQCCYCHHSTAATAITAALTHRAQHCYCHAPRRHRSPAAQGTAGAASPPPRLQGPPPPPWGEDGGPAAAASVAAVAAS